MPNKSRRVASKQAELGKRRRRSVKRPVAVEAHVPITRFEAATSVEKSTEDFRTEASAPALAKSLSRVVPQERPISAAAHRTLNPYIWPEIKRIGVITGFVLILLASLTVLLG